MKISILDYVPLFENRTSHEALNHSVQLAQEAEILGFERYWIAEHHKVQSVVSSAPEIIMMSLLEQTHQIRIGSGGIMLPHYSPYKVAEQFKIMEARHPNRIELGIGRSPSFKNVNEALNENKIESLDYETQINDLEKYFKNDTVQPHRFQSLTAMPQVETYPQRFILGMSKKSAELAAKIGLPFVIAQTGQDAKDIKTIVQYYKDTFKQFHTNQDNIKPYVIMSTFVVTANSEEKVSQLLSALDLWLSRIHYLNQPPYYPSINTALKKNWTEREIKIRDKNRDRIISGTPQQVASKLEQMKTFYELDEMMVLPHVYGEENRVNLLHLVANELILDSSK